MRTIICVILLFKAFHTIAHVPNSSPQAYAQQSPQKVPTARSRKSGAATEPVMPKRIAVGADLSKALDVFAAAGISRKSAWQMGPSEKDADVTWRDIDEGITIAIFYKVTTNTITELKMMYIPPLYDRRGNMRIVDAESLEFFPDGTYSVRYFTSRKRQLNK